MAESLSKVDIPIWLASLIILLEDTFMKASCLPIALIALVAGCLASPTIDLEQHETVSMVAQELGEAGCATMGLAGNPTNGTIISQPSFQCSFHNVGVSPDSSYGTSECPSQFVTEIHGVAGRAFNFTVNTPDLAVLDEATCNKLRMTLGAYGHKASGWSLLGTVALRGEWRSLAPGFGFCQVLHVSGGIPSITGSEGYDMVRAAGSAYTVEVYKGEPYNSYRKVQAGIYGGSPC